MAAQKRDDLALYYYDYCPFCVRVLHALQKLDLEVEMRHIHKNPEYKDELLQARGRGTVPVLRIQGEDGEDTWMPESADIVRYLQGVAANS